LTGKSSSLLVLVLVLVWVLAVLLVMVVEVGEVVIAERVVEIE